MATDRAECDNCGFKQNKIYLYAYSGANAHMQYACFKCKKIISFKGDLEKCPDCGSKVRPYNEFHRDGYYICPKCKKRKLKFYHETFS